MPILAIDKFGNFYETDPDMSDGTGCKCEPPKSKGGDVTLDNSIAKAESKRQADQAYENALKAHEDHVANQIKAQENQQRHIEQQASSKKAFIENLPAFKEAAMKEGLKQGQTLVDCPVGISGFGLSPEGLPGEAASRTKDQVGAAMALGVYNPFLSSPLMPGSKGKSIKPEIKSESLKTPVHPVDIEEKKQWLLTQQVTKMTQAQVNQSKAWENRMANLKVPSYARPANTETKYYVGPQGQVIEREVAVKNIPDPRWNPFLIFLGRR